MARNAMKFGCHFCVILGMDYLCARLIPDKMRETQLLYSSIPQVSLSDHTYVSIIC